LWYGVAQEGRVVRIMRKRLVRKSLDMIKELAAQEDKSAYNNFFESFGRQLKVTMLHTCTP
jgi:heat shock protein beta